MENFAYNNVDYLELKSVSFGYNDNEVLHDVSMRLERVVDMQLLDHLDLGKRLLLIQ